MKPKDMESIPIEKVLSFTTSMGNSVRKNCYILHPTGGKHVFYHSEAAEGTIYKELVWPWVERIGEGKTKQKQDNNYLKPTCYKGNPYPYWTFYVEGPFKKIKIKDAKTGERWLDRKMHILCHKILARSFISKPKSIASLPHRQICINHINEIKADYRVSNLEWTTASKNSTGYRSDQRISLDERYLMYKRNGWV